MRNVYFSRHIDFQVLFQKARETSSHKNTFVFGPAFLYELQPFKSTHGLGYLMPSVSTYYLPPLLYIQHIPKGGVIILEPNKYPVLKYGGV